MEKVIEAREAGSQFGEMLAEIIASGDNYVVERNGEPVAAVVPIEMYEGWKQDRQIFFAQMRAAAERANLSPEEADVLAAEAVQAVRAQNRQ